MKKWLVVAEKAYQAFGDKADWHYQGNPMLKWEDLPRPIQEVWAVACEAAVKASDAINRITTFHTA